MATRAAWAPRWRAPWVEANQPAWRAAAPAAERKRESKFKTHSEKTKTEVSSDTYPLRDKANRACGEAPRAPVSAGAAEGCPAAGFGAASALGA
jgi:hypothetical protein